MITLIEYAEINKNKTFKDLPLNTLDIAILSQIVFIDFSFEITKYKTKTTFKEMYNKYKTTNLPLNSELFMSKEIKEIFDIIALSKRFRNIKIIDYKNKINLSNEFQFCAITLNITKNLNCIVFSGTDDSLISWKENFNLAYLSVIPSQILAKNYLCDSIKKYKIDTIVTGHSKGGNLALYASLFANKPIQSKIKKIYLFDSPGIQFKNKEKLDLSPIKNKINLYIPYMSIVGRLFYHNEKTFIVKSNDKGIWQHNLFSWQVDINNEFKYSKHTSKYSNDFANKFKDLILTLPIDERICLIENTFKILNSTSAKTLYDLFSHKTKEFLNKIKSLDKGTQQYLSKMYKKLLLDKTIQKIIIDSTLGHKFSKKSKKS